MNNFVTLNSFLLTLFEEITKKKIDPNKVEVVSVGTSHINNEWYHTIFLSTMENGVKKEITLEIPQYREKLR